MPKFVKLTGSNINIQNVDKSKGQINSNTELFINLEHIVTVRKTYGKNNKVSYQIGTIVKLFYDFETQNSDYIKYLDRTIQSSDSEDSTQEDIAAIKCHVESLHTVVGNRILTDDPLFE